MWAARYDGPGHTDDWATAIALSADGATVFVTGYSAADFATVAYDATTGIRRWVARFDGSGNDYAQAIAVSPDGGGLFVAGFSTDAVGAFDYTTVAYDAETGAQRWVARYEGPGDSYDDAHALGVSPDGLTVFVTGGSIGAFGTFDYATVAYEAATGIERWVARYDGPAGGGDVANALRIGPDGATVLVTGYSSGTGGSLDYATVAYEAATGAQRWAARYDGLGEDDDATALGLSPDGGMAFATGWSARSAANGDYATVAYDVATGAERWVARFNGPTNNDDQAADVAVNAAGSAVFVTGKSYQSTLRGYDRVTLAYDAATGDELWQARYEGPGDSNDSPTELAISPDGATLFVTGASTNSDTSGDISTVAYATATGREWSLTRMGPGSGSALRVRPDGSSLFVAGRVGNLNEDFAIVAYDLLP